ncbi:hypothetical protein MIR68_006131 [Amoeboaphelidium protococcarum]|nr:hypothetical protein MIR68_006131 [Amoeboaphelidium protococcarum]
MAQLIMHSIDYQAADQRSRDIASCVPVNIISIPKKALVAISTRISNPGSKSEPDISAAEQCIIKMTKCNTSKTTMVRPLIPGLDERVVIKVGDYHGNGMLEASMLMKTSGCSRKPYVFIPADLSAQAPSKGDILVIGMSHPHNFGSGNPYYIAEFLEFLQCAQTGQHQIPLKDVYLVCVGFEIVGGVVHLILPANSLNDLFEQLELQTFVMH